MQKKPVHHFHNVQSYKKEGPECESNSRLPIAIPCTTPLSHENIC